MGVRGKVRAKQEIMANEGEERANKKPPVIDFSESSMLWGFVHLPSFWFWQILLSKVSLNKKRL